MLSGMVIGFGMIIGKNLYDRWNASVLNSCTPNIDSKSSTPNIDVKSSTPSIDVKATSMSPVDKVKKLLDDDKVDEAMAEVQNVNLSSQLGQQYILRADCYFAMGDSLYAHVDYKRAQDETLSPELYRWSSDRLFVIKNHPEVCTKLKTKYDAKKRRNLLVGAMTKLYYDQPIKKASDKKDEKEQKDHLVGRDQKDEMPTELICCVCMERRRSVVFKPCEHMSCCSECSLKIKKCPICRETINSVSRVFLS